jgi:O-antigen/teichoic acid export membrane protein
MTEDVGVDKGAPEAASRLERSEILAASMNVFLRGLTLATKFLFLIMIARLYAPADVGLYGVMASSIAFAVFGLGLEYHYFTIRILASRRDDERAHVLRDQAVLYALVAAASLPPLALLLYGGILSFLPVWAIGWFLALTLVELFSHEAGIALVAIQRPLQANLVVFVRTGLWTIPVIALAYAMPSSRGLSSVFLAWLVGGLVSLVVAAVCMRGLGFHRVIFAPIDWKLMGKGLRTAAPFVVISGASIGLLFLDRFVINAYRGLEEVGIYTFFANITMALHTLVNTGVTLIRMPRLVRAHQAGDPAAFRAEFLRMVKITVGGTIGIAAVIGVAIFPVLHFVGKPIYARNVDVFYIMLAAASVRCVADLPVAALYAKELDLRLLGVFLASFVVSLVGNLLLVPLASIRGAALAANLAALAVLLGAIAANVWWRRAPAKDGSSTLAPTLPNFS